MTRISVYLQDFEDKQIDEICEKYDCSTDYFLSMILEAIEDGKIDLDDIM